MLIAFIAAASLGAMPQPVRPPRSDFTSLPSLSDVSAVSGARVALTIDIAGKPQRCDVVTRSTVERLDRVGCALLVRSMRYRPATDESGTPVAAIVEQGIAINGGAPPPRNVDFALPVSRLTNASDAIADARVITDPDGHVTSCAIAATSGSPALDRLVCPGLAAVTLPPAQTAAGVPLRAMRLVSAGFMVGAITRRVD